MICTHNGPYDINYTLSNATELRNLFYYEKNDLVDFTIKSEDSTIKTTLAEYFYYDVANLVYNYWKINIFGILCLKRRQIEEGELRISIEAPYSTIFIFKQYDFMSLNPHPNSFIFKTNIYKCTNKTFNFDRENNFYLEYGPPIPWYCLKKDIDKDGSNEIKWQYCEIIHFLNSGFFNDFEDFLKTKKRHHQIIF